MRHAPSHLANHVSATASVLSACDVCIVYTAQKRRTATPWPPCLPRLGRVGVLCSTPLRIYLLYNDAQCRGHAEIAETTLMYLGSQLCIWSRSLIDFFSERRTRLHEVLLSCWPGGGAHPGSIWGSLAPIATAFFEHLQSTLS